MDTLEQTKAFFTELSPLLIGVIVLAAIFLVVGLRLVFKKPPSHLTAFSGDAGSVLVSRKALQELIKQACLLDEWVEAARPVVRVKNAKVSANVELRLATPENLKEICERVQSRITALLQKSLSFDQIGDIQIVVKSFSPQPEREVAAQPASSPLTAIESGKSPRKETRALSPASDQEEGAQREPKQEKPET